MTDAIAAISPQTIVETTSARSQPVQHAVDQFSQLMSTIPEMSVQNLGGNDTVASKMLQHNEALMKQTFADVRAFTEQAPSMNQAELMSRHIALQFQMSSTQMQFNAGVYVAQSGKSGLQTLMKNQ